jgi:hypothetical protein
MGDAELVLDLVREWIDARQAVMESDGGPDWIERVVRLDHATYRLYVAAGRVDDAYGEIENTPPL